MTENKEKAQSSHITNFLRNIINEDLKQGVNDPRHWCGHPGTYTEQMEGPIDEAKVRLRFPPEPNGYLHIGHAKSICLNFGLAKDYAGRCHMRFDDTNPVKEDQEYVDSILGSVNWLGFDWKDAKETNFYFASDYFDYMYEIAEHMIKTAWHTSMNKRLNRLKKTGAHFTPRRRLSVSGSSGRRKSAPLP